jgi:hypothetical protein
MTNPSAAVKRLAAGGAQFWIVLGAVHLAACLVMWILPRLGVLPGLANPRGIWAFAVDASDFHRQATQLTDVLSNRGVVAWWTASAEVHSRITSLLYAAFGKSSLSALPLLTGGYLLIVFTVMKIGEAVFDRTTGVTAALVVAVWPSFVAHTTQLLRDPFYIGGELALVYGLVRLAHSNGRAWSDALTIAAWSVVGFFAAFSVRGYLAEANTALLCLALALFGVRAVVARSLPWRTAIVGVSMLVVFANAALGRIASGGSDTLAPTGRPPAGMILTRGAETNRTGGGAAGSGAGAGGRRSSVGGTAAQADDAAAGDEHSSAISAEMRGSNRRPGIVVEDRFTRLILRIVEKRNDFNSMPTEAATNIDQHIKFTKTADVVRYMPRAAQIGLAAPFPTAWFATGASTGRIGRMVAGLETAAMYVFLLLAIAALVRRRRDTRLWLLGAFALGGMVALGMVVGNVGILFRMRYPFWFVAVVLGVAELRRVLANAGRGAGDLHTVSAARPSGPIEADVS